MANQPRKSVVYILGAGFSAPWGIPVMRRFVDVARTLRRSNPQLKDFSAIIDRIRGTRTANEYFNHDHTNIEHALSLLEMTDTLVGNDIRRDLVEFIIQVIKETTLPAPDFSPEKMPAKKWEMVFTLNQKWQGYCAFLASLAHLKFTEGLDYAQRGIHVESSPTSTRYSVVSLNYDLLLENVSSFLVNQYWWDSHSGPPLESSIRSSVWPRFIKLHGSVSDPESIIPPTFNKGLYGSDIPETWRAAYDLIAEANEIRILGYSLPETDSYIKYLLMAATNRHMDLDRIDWISLDLDGQLHKRVDDFIRFGNRRFLSKDIEHYLSSIFNYTNNTKQSRGQPSISFDLLEAAHENFMATP